MQTSNVNQFGNLWTLDCLQKYKSRCSNNICNNIIRHQRKYNTKLKWKTIKLCFQYMKCMHIVLNYQRTLLLKQKNKCNNHRWLMNTFTSQQILDYSQRLNFNYFTYIYLCVWVHSSSVWVWPETRREL